MLKFLFNGIRVLVALPVVATECAALVVAKTLDCAGLPPSLNTPGDWAAKLDRLGGAILPRYSEAGK